MNSIKKLAVASVLFGGMMMLPTIGYAENADEFNYSLLEDGTISITGYTGSDTQVIIPDQIDGKTISKIGEGAFFSQTRIESIVLPDTIESIEDGAFVNCVSLTSFEMPDSVENIGEYLFARDSALETVKLSQSITELPNLTFYFCDSLKEVEIPEGVVSLGDAVFYSCSNLEEISFPNTLESIGAGCFQSLQKVKSMELPVKSVGPDTFTETFIETVKFTGELTSIEADAFTNAYIGELYLPESVSSIDTMAFTNGGYAKLTVDENNPWYCSDDNTLYTKDHTTLLKYPCNESVQPGTITIPETVTTIGDYAFYGLTYTEDEENPENNYLVLELPPSVSQIGKRAFGNSNITQISIPGSVEEIPEFLFASARGMKVLELAEGTKTIDAKIFIGHQTLETIKIPSSVTDIDPEAFSGCSFLKEIVIDEDNENYIIRDGCLYDKAGETLLTYLPISQSEEYCSSYVIPEGTKAIGEKAFLNSELEEVILPDTLTQIGDKAFYGCQIMKTLNVPSTVNVFGEECLGYTNPAALETDTLIENFRLIAEAGSKAADYAKANGIACFTKEYQRPAEEILLQTGETCQLDQTGIFPETVQYTSSDETIAYCDQDGNVTALSPGTTSIVMSCGVYYVPYQIQVSGEPVDDGHIPTDLLTGREYDFDPSRFTVLTEEKDFDEYLSRFKECNSERSYDLLDNININCYSGDEYKALQASRGNPIRARQIMENPAWRHLELFSLISDGLKEELSDYQVDMDVVFFRGISAAVDITGTGNSISDMKASIGTIYESSTPLSTSLAHYSANGYAGISSERAVLEIYAPKEIVNGAYISGISKFPEELEYLINEGSRFLILDAGVREVQLNADWGKAVERYFKLLMIPEE